MMRCICPEDKCTACEACVVVCPQKCIQRQFNEDRSWKLVIEEDKCIGCRRCEKACPNLTKPYFYAAKESYAAWRTDFSLHMQSASGGLASVFYEYAASKQMWFAGVFLDDKFEAHFRLTKNMEEISEFRNSKYTFSFVGTVYSEIIDKLKKGENVLFIGLPCQVAALKNIIQMYSLKGRLITVDLVCHGTPAPIYLQQHIQFIENKQNQSFEKCYFRDAKFDTSNFAYTLYTHNSKEPNYMKYVDQDDNYQIGYHNALIYREVCYNCSYAKRERVSDITIGDYHGLGSVEPYLYEKKNVSSMIIHTEEGQRFVDSIYKEGLITMHKRPLEEPMIHEKQFNHPSIAPEARNLFLELYKKEKDFDKSADSAFIKYKRKNLIRRTLHIRQIKTKLIRMIPRSVKEQVKVILRKVKG